VTVVEKLLTQARDRLVTVAHDAPLLEAAKLLQAGTDIIVVCDSAGLVTGVVTKTDVVGQMSVCGGASCIQPVSMVMTRTIFTCRPGDLLNDVWAMMKQRELKNVPVIDLESRPLGVLNARDALQVLLQETEDEELLLRDYVMGIGYH
jgi:CBS domain-containing protein